MKKQIAQQKDIPNKENYKQINTTITKEENGHAEQDLQNNQVIQKNTDDLKNNILDKLPTLAKNTDNLINNDANDICINLNSNSKEN